MDNQNYEPKSVEQKWQKAWEKSGIFNADDTSDKEKFYCLSMFPYPSGAGIHLGHVENYVGADIYSRFQKMRGFNVFQPIGWDAFGLPAENNAIKTGIHPDKNTHDNIKNFTRQLKQLGIAYDWSKEIDTSSPEYYKWTQWMFLQMYKNGLAYKKKAKVNWCNSCQTVLANEQAEGGKCERCKNSVIQKDLDQWFFKITDFVEDQNGIKGLINGLDDIDWPESTKIAQKNWIGRSEGAIVKFKVKSQKSIKSDPPSLKLRTDKVNELEVFTTRPDTLFGCTYMVVSSEHEIIKNQELGIKNYEDVQQYVENSKKKSEIERTDISKEKTGVELKGIKAINPVNGEEIPIYVADYVLSGYGTGAIMAVPAHDERDYEFAKKYNIPIRKVILPEALQTILRDSRSIAMGAQEDVRVEADLFVGEGVAVNSEFLNGMKTEDAKEKMIEWLEENNCGGRKTNYRLRDWLVSRQRYWGAPIPIIYCENCGEVPVPEDQLPVKLPTDVDFKPTGESPLVRSKSFHDVKCPKCGKPARRESDTMDTFVCSSWYFLRFIDPKNEKEFSSKEKIDKWLPVDTYIGGAEHAVLHLLYARFFTKVLQKFGHVNFNEPFTKLRHQGIILGEDGNKMSKSLGNVVDPNIIIDEFGTDVLRIHVMFMGPFDEMKPWSSKGIIGLKRFLDKIHNLKLITHNMEHTTIDKLQKLLHKTIKKVTEDIENFKFNTAISSMMILVNAMEREKEIDKNDYEKLLIMLAPFAPHMAEELWSSYATLRVASEDKSSDNGKSIFHEAWPKYNPELVKDDKINLPIQVNGKIRDIIEVDVDMSEEGIKAEALKSDKVQKWVKSGAIKKVIYVKDRMVSIVI